MTIKILIKANSSLFLTILSGTSLLIVNIIYNLAFPVGTLTWFIVLSEVLLCSGLTFLFICTTDGFKKPVHTPAELAGFAVIGASIILTLSQMSWSEFNLGQFIAILFTLIAAISFGASGGSITGLLCCVTLVLFTKNFALFGGVLAVSGFISGIFKPIGKVLQSIMFVGMFLICSAFLGGLTMQVMVEVIICAIIAPLLPTHLLLNKNIEAAPESISNENFTDDLSLKLKFTAHTLLDLQDSVEECAEKIDTIKSNDLNNIYKRCASEVCRKCGLNTFCWVTAHNDTMRSFNEISETLKQQGSIHKEIAPAFLKQKCCRMPDLIQSINLGYRDFLSKEQASRRIKEARSIATQQFSGMSNLLMEMSSELSEINEIDETANASVSNLLRDYGIRSEGVSCALDQFDRMTIDIYTDKAPSKNELISLSESLCDLLEREFEPPSINHAKENTKISFFETASLSIDFASEQSCFEKGGYCGDSYDFFMDSKGFAHIILSDGMGTGSRAALDSVMTCSTMHRLLQTGFGFDSAFKLMNLSFAVKSSDESLATVDVCTVDLYTGCTKFVKAGAASSFISKNGRLTELSATSLPIGIIQGTRFDEEEVRLCSGDLIVMVSDGATTQGSEWIAEEVKLLKNRPSKVIAKSLLESAKKRTPIGHGDDITVLVASIKNS